MGKINNSFDSFASHKILIGPVGVFLATILGDAVEQNKIKTAKRSLNLLKKFDSFVLEQVCDKKGNTLLHYAAKNSNHEMVRLFIRNKIDVNSRNQYGHTPLTIAIGNALAGNYRYNQQDLSDIEYLNRNRNNGDALFTIVRLLEAGAEFDKAEYNMLLNITTDYEKTKKHLYSCQEIKKILYDSHIYDAPVHNNKRSDKLLCNIDDTPEDIYAEVNNNHIYDKQTHCQQKRRVRFAESDQLLENKASENGCNSGDNTKQEASESAPSSVNQPNNRTMQLKSILKQGRKATPKTEVNGVSQEKKDCSSSEKSAIQKPCGKVRNLTKVFESKAHNTPNSKISSSFTKGFADSRNL